KPGSVWCLSPSLARNPPERKYRARRTNHTLLAIERFSIHTFGRANWPSQPDPDGAQIGKQPRPRWPTWWQGWRKGWIDERRSSAKFADGKPADRAGGAWDPDGAIRG